VDSTASTYLGISQRLGLATEFLTLPARGWVPPVRRSKPIQIVRRGSPQGEKAVCARVDVLRSTKRRGTSRGPAHQLGIGTQRRNRATEG